MTTQVSTFLKELKRARIYYELAHYRDDAISVIVSVPGQRWEIDFLEDGSVDVERFLSNGEIHGKDALSELFEQFSEPAEAELNAAGRAKSVARKQKRSAAAAHERRTASKV
jgi:hypothetical protein